MYPLSGDTGYVRNTWYVAALREEVTREPIERWFSIGRRRGIQPLDTFSVRVSS